METLPAIIGQLTRLQHLEIAPEYYEPDRLKFKSLPTAIGNLTDLQTLTIKGSRLSSLPPETGNLTQMRELHLGKNAAITALPPEIGCLKICKYWMWKTMG